MGRYWDHEGPNQADYDRLTEELVPMQGKTGTLEGEFLRAAGKLGYEFYNNGGGNNVSGALRLLRDLYPAFDYQWWDTLAPYVTGRGGKPSEEVYAACESIVDSVTVYVAGRQGNYTPSEADMRDFTVLDTGVEPAEEYEEDPYPDLEVEEDTLAI